jgi:hypothetical protein
MLELKSQHSGTAGATGPIALGPRLTGTKPLRALEEPGNFPLTNEHMKRFLGIALALGLTGCETIGNTVGNLKYDFESGSYTDRTTAVMSACKARLGARSLDPIRNKVELFKDPPDGPVRFAVETDNYLPTMPEQTAIAAWAQAIQQCQTDARKVLDDMPVPPGATQAEANKVISYVTDAWIQGADLRVQLYKGQMSYADYANQRLKVADDALKTALRYAEDTDEENGNHDLEDAETVIGPFASLM